MEGEQSTTVSSNANDSMNNLLFVEMGVGYDQHGQDITAAAMRACRDAISSNSIPAFRRGSIPGVSFEQMKLQIKLGVPRAVQQFLDIERVKSVFPYGKILSVDVVDGGLICSSGVHVEEMGDKNDDCYVVNAANSNYPLLFYSSSCAFLLYGHVSDSDKEIQGFIGRSQKNAWFVIVIFN
ncbi:Conserved hypothetical protein CHP02058 [Macleaya cordata]|uniref:Uncharacterized protein n=1 Tax=Macleaya cordata TaxID=56857 RepID=A0A200QFF8_MACCD|nr:Conserved hypothetical protein CHP02058 [Macleaya cordata]